MGEAEERGAEQLHVHNGRGADDGDLHLHVGAGRGRGAGGEVEQVGETAALVVIHGGDLGRPDLAVGLPGDGGDVAGRILGEHRRGDVLKVEGGRKGDAAAEPGFNDAGIDAGFQTGVQIEQKLRLVIAARTGHDFAARESRQGYVRDVKAVKGIERIAGFQGLSDAVGVVAEGEIGRRSQAAGGHDAKRHRPEAKAENRHTEARLGLEQRHLVSEQHRVAAGKYVHPVGNVGDIFHHLEPAAAYRAGAAPGRGAFQPGHLGFYGTQENVRQGHGPHRGRPQPPDVAQVDDAAVGPRADGVGHIEHGLHSMDKGPVDGGLSLEQHDGVDQVHDVVNSDDAHADVLVEPVYHRL